MAARGLPNGVRFEWDRQKAEQNRRKHRIDFNQALHVFLDANRYEDEDDRYDYGETRLRVVGAVGFRLITVIYTRRDDTIRIISARKASHDEIERYHHGRF
ncbi:MAG: BrnT family toxin [Candidatus Poribacteria bacterium]|nr:BrnT family toxin [Candidatus Poribacteria bacterium]